MPGTMSHSYLPYSRTSCHVWHIVVARVVFTKHLIQTRQGANLFTYIISFKRKNNQAMLLRENVAENGDWVKGLLQGV